MKRSIRVKLSVQQKLTVEFLIAKMFTITRLTKILPCGRGWTRARSSQRKISPLHLNRGFSRSTKADLELVQSSSRADKLFIVDPKFSPETGHDVEVSVGYSRTYCAYYHLAQCAEERRPFNSDNAIPGASK